MSFFTEEDRLRGMCVRRKRYLTNETAKEAAGRAKVTFKAERLLEPYSCPICGGFHLRPKLSRLARPKRAPAGGGNGPPQR